MTDEKFIEILERTSQDFYVNEVIAANKIIKRGQVEAFHYHGDGHVTSRVNVHRSFDVEIFLANDGYIYLDCSCTKNGFCSHVVATVIYTIVQLKGNQKTTSQQLISSAKRKLDKPEITLGPGQSFKQALDLIVLPNNTRNLQVGEVVVYNSKKLECHAYTASNYWNLGKVILHVNKEGNQISFECTSCRKGPRVCNHVESLLKTPFYRELMISFFDDDRTYDSLVEKLCTKGNFTRESFDKYCILVQGQDTIGVITKAKSTIFDLPLFEKKPLDLVEREKRFFAHLEKKASFGSALCWTNEELIKINGKLSKDGRKLVSHIEQDPSQNYFSPRQSKIYQSLMDAQMRGTYSFHYALLQVREVLSQANFIHYMNGNDDFYVRKSDYKQISFVSDLAVLCALIIPSPDVMQFKYWLECGGKKIELSELEWFNNHAVLTKSQQLFLFDNSEIGAFLEHINRWDELVFFTHNKAAVEDLWETTMRLAKVKDVLQITLSGGVRQVQIRKVEQYFVFEPFLMYKDIKAPLLSGEQLIDKEAGIQYKVEDKERTEFINKLQGMHPSWDTEVHAQNYFYLSDKEVMENEWFLDFFAECSRDGIEIFGQENITKEKFNFHKPSIHHRLSSGTDWFESKVTISFGDLAVPQRQWVESVRNHNKFVKLGDGTLGILPQEWFEKLKVLLNYADDTKGDLIRISKYKFNVIDKLFDSIDDEDIREELLAKKQALSNFDQSKKHALPEGILADLRPYQQAGFQWLKFLEEFNFGGCLADDMGLGKTLQVLTLLMDQKSHGRGLSLVVVPRTLLFNWKNELEKFTPNLSYLIYHGQQRTWEESLINQVDVMITTYDVLARDIEQFMSMTFNYAILDESQAIKNTSSQRYKAVRLIKSRQRLVMTGTPIENNTFDLYAQFSFINPGMLGSHQQFSSKYSQAIDQRGDVNAAKDLKQLIHPFLLRRTKDLVAQELPEKSESVIYCEMDQKQKALYEALKLKIKEDIEQAMVEKGVQNSKIKVLEGLTQLRLMCNSPHLLNPSHKEAVIASSAKIEVLMEQLEEVMGDHKVLVYSQFVKMLNLVRGELDARGVKYAYLDGSTTNREQAVAEFMNQPDCDLFLLSLKAGNAGLNLTKADYVYLIDPWWNPAVEAQAIDRTHRIGQTNKVFAYKMICRDTIEEKILDLQKKKKKLSGDLIGVDENVFKSLDKEEILALFE